MQKKGMAKLMVGLLLLAGIQLTACKHKAKAATDTTTTTVDTTTQVPVQINTDDALTTGVRDATKDFPGVTAAVANGEITLTGTISRAKLSTLMAALNSLKPKKINNNLTIK